MSARLRTRGRARPHSKRDTPPVWRRPGSRRRLRITGGCAVYTTEGPMPRNQPFASNTSAQLSVRCDAELKERYKDALDAEGRTMSEDLRRHMERAIAEHGGSVGNAGHLPDDDELATAYTRSTTSLTLTPGPSRPRPGSRRSPTRSTVRSRRCDGRYWRHSNGVDTSVRSGARSGSSVELISLNNR